VRDEVSDGTRWFFLHNLLESQGISIALAKARGVPADRRCAQASERMKEVGVSRIAGNAPRPKERHDVRLAEAQGEGRDLAVLFLELDWNV